MISQKENRHTNKATLSARPLLALRACQGNERARVNILFRYLGIQNYVILMILGTRGTLEKFHAVFESRKTFPAYGLYAFRQVFAHGLLRAFGQGLPKTIAPRHKRQYRTQSLLGSVRSYSVPARDFSSYPLEKSQLATRCAHLLASGFLIPS